MIDGTPNDFRVKLNILRDVLQKKLSALELVLNISENQETILQAPVSAERASAFAETNKEKQKLIETVLECDSVFQGLFDSMRNELISGGGAYRAEIEVLQGLIDEVLEKDVNIRAQEQKNNKAMNASQIQTPRPSFTNARRNKILSEYEKHKKQ